MPYTHLSKFPGEWRFQRLQVAVVGLGECRNWFGTSRNWPIFDFSHGPKLTCPSGTRSRGGLGLGGIFLEVEIRGQGVEIQTINENIQRHPVTHLLRFGIWTPKNLPKTPNLRRYDCPLKSDDVFGKLTPVFLLDFGSLVFWLASNGELPSCSLNIVCHPFLLRIVTFGDGFPKEFPLEPYPS